MIMRTMIRRDKLFFNVKKSTESKDKDTEEVRERRKARAALEPHTHKQCMSKEKGSCTPEEKGETCKLWQLSQLFFGGRPADADGGGEEDEEELCELFFSCGLCEQQQVAGGGREGAARARARTRARRAGRARAIGVGGLWWAPLNFFSMPFSVWAFGRS